MSVDVVVGAQLGSEAKGHVAAQLAKRFDYDWLVRVAGPNAGHTAYDADDRAWALRQIPVAAVVDPDANLYLGPGSEIDLEVLRTEVEALEANGHKITGRLVISSQASILAPEHRFREQQAQMHESMGSTGKGVGACRAERIMRKCPIVGNMAVRKVVERYGSVADLEPADFERSRVMIEGTQGYGLGLHAGYYPHCTSSDCRDIDFMAMAGAPMSTHRFTYLVARTLPIRVAGPSGELLDEVTWEQLAEESGGYIQPERTTVTKKIRRIGRFNPQMVRDAIAANSRVRLCLTFWDYIDRREVRPEQAWMNAQRWLHSHGVPPEQLYMVTTGPNEAIIA